MKSFFEIVFGRTVIATAPVKGAEPVKPDSLSDFDRRVRKLEKDSGRMFLP
jgi:hypothetical protein